MAWLTNFSLGRPGYEYQFDVNPGVCKIAEQSVAVRNRNLVGDLKKSVIKYSAPIVKINSNYLTKATRDKLASLAGIQDTFLSFQTRDDWAQNLEYDTPNTTTTVTLQNTSATRLSAALVAAGFASQLSAFHAYTKADGTGTDYFNAGSYADATNILTLGTAVPDATKPVYVTYTYKGWLVDMKSFDHTAEGGKVDLWSYDFELQGA